MAWTANVSGMSATPRAGSGPEHPGDAGDAGPLIEEAMRKTGIVWVAAPGERAWPAWFHWHDGAAYLVTGDGEQPLPALTAGGTAEVVVPSKDTGARLIGWLATVAEVPPGGELWQQVVPAMHAKRLNPLDGDLQPQRWARECVLLRLEPTGEVLDQPRGSGAAAPPPTPATTSGPLPYVLGRRRKRG